jgi:hypothetical protein
LTRWILSIWWREEDDERGGGHWVNFFQKILFFYFIFFWRLLYRKLFPVGWAVPSILYDTIPFVSHLYVHNIPPSFLFLCVCLFSIYNLQVKKRKKKRTGKKKGEKFRWLYNTTARVKWKKKKKRCATTTGSDPVCVWCIIKNPLKQKSGTIVFRKISKKKSQLKLNNNKSSPVLYTTSNDYIAISPQKWKCILI